MSYLLAVDQGTTSSRAIVYDRSFKIVSSAQKEFTQFYPEPGFVEHDAEEIFDTVVSVIRTALEKGGIDPHDIDAIGITNQRETTVVWDKNTGKPVMNAIVWQCRRTSGIVDRLVADGFGDMIKEKTGLIPDAYFSGTKIKWILDNVPGARERAKKGDLRFGTIDSWLIMNLTGGKVHVTDRTNASRTMLYNIRTLSWDRDLLDLLGIPAAMLPEVKPSSCLFGVTDKRLFGAEIPIMGVAGDQQCALFGQGCFEAGQMKNTYGTGCFMLLNTGSVPVESHSGLITTVAASVGDDVRYALEGSVFVAGAAIQWLRDELKMIGSSSESESWAVSVPDTAGGYVVPAFTGLGAPYWDQDARGIVVGLTRGFSKAHFIRATLESLAYQTHDIVRAMEQDAGLTVSSLKVDGGACLNNFLMQFQSDILGCDVVRPSCTETTALGAAYLAALSAGWANGTSDLGKGLAVDRVFSPSCPDEKRAALLKGWEKAVRCARVWGENN